MTDSQETLYAAIEEYNRAERAHLEIDHGLRWLGNDGPVYLAGGVRIRGLFVDRDGQHWGDAILAIESHSPDPGYREWASDRAHEIEPHHEIFQFSKRRGQVFPMIAPVARIAEFLEVDPPELFPAGWTRSWDTPEADSDERGLLLAAHGLGDLT